MTAKPNRPLSCHRCGSTALAVDGASNTRRTRRGVLRRVAWVECRNPRCRNDWWSTHPDARKLAKANRRPRR